MQSKNYTILKILILEEIQKEMSTSDISKLMGFKFDKFSRWKKNLKILKWDEFTKLCDIMGLRLIYALDVVNYQLTEEVTNDIFFTYLKQYNAFSSNQLAADYLKCHLSVVKRYSSGETVPDIETIFNLLDYKPNILSSFLRRLLNRKINNSILNTWIEKDVKPTVFEATLPISSLIEACLYLNNYHKRNESTIEWLSDLLDFDQEIINEALVQMIESKIISLVEDTKDTFIPTHKMINLDGLESSEVIPFIQFLNLKLVGLLEKKKNSEYKPLKVPGAMIFRVFPASHQAMHKINVMLSQVHSDILKTIDEDDQPKIEARALLLQTFSITK